jgi:hypothetical protein
MFALIAEATIPVASADQVGWFLKKLLRHPGRSLLRAGCDAGSFIGALDQPYLRD